MSLHYNQNIKYHIEYSRAIFKKWWESKIESDTITEDEKRIFYEARMIVKRYESNRAENVRSKAWGTHLERTMECQRRNAVEYRF